MRHATFLALCATVASLVLGACGGSSRGRHPPAAPPTPLAAANPVQRENARPGTPGWRIPAGAGTVITGYASETSLVPGQTVHLHVSAPPGSRYRVLVYRLGWYGGIGGRLITCVPGCRSSRASIAQPRPTSPARVTGLLRAPWRVTDRVVIPPDAVSGYFEAKLEIVRGTHAGAVGSVPLIVRQSPSAPTSAVLVQVPVNTWEAYNPWGGKSLYGFGTARHAVEVSFERPFDQRELHDMGTELELPWVRFLEREGIDVSYQTDADTDARPGSLLHHRLVFAIGHDEYWTQRMRRGFDRALALSTNLMFGSNSGEWRMRYADGRRTIVEWRDPAIDPIRDRRRANGFFKAFGEPECRLMGVEHRWAAQRPLTAPPTPYTVVGPGGDPWLEAAGLKPGDVIPGVVGYEWDSRIPGCFAGRVVPLMTARIRGSNGVSRSADLVRATAPSGGRVLAMGTMELGWALGGLDGRTPNAHVVAFVRAALRDLTRPAPPAALRIRRRANGMIVSARLRAPDPRIVRVSVRPLRGGRGCADSLRSACRLPLPGRTTRYVAVAIDRWGASQPLTVAVLRGPRPGASFGGAPVAIPGRARSRAGVVCRGDGERRGRWPSHLPRRPPHAASRSCGR
jgi:hypothetical protein